MYHYFYICVNYIILYYRSDFFMVNAVGARKSKFNPPKNKFVHTGLLQNLKSISVHYNENKNVCAAGSTITHFYRLIQQHENACCTTMLLW